MNIWYDEQGNKRATLTLVRASNHTVCRHEFWSPEQAKSWLQQNNEFFSEYKNETKIRLYYSAKRHAWVSSIHHADFDSVDSAKQFCQSKGYILHKVKEVPTSVL